MLRFAYLFIPFASCSGLRPAHDQSDNQSFVSTTPRALKYEVTNMPEYHAMRFWAAMLGGRHRHYWRAWSARAAMQLAADTCSKIRCQRCRALAACVAAQCALAAPVQHSAQRATCTCTAARPWSSKLLRRKRALHGGAARACVTAVLMWL